MAHRILVFESDPHFTAELRRGFATRAVELDVAADGNKGLDRAAAAKPDLILLSIELQGMNGFLVCKKIKKDPELASVPLLILSADPGGIDVAVRAVHVGLERFAGAFDALLLGARSARRPGRRRLRRTRRRLPRASRPPPLRLRPPGRRLSKLR